VKAAEPAPAIETTAPSPSKETDATVTPPPSVLTRFLLRDGRSIDACRIIELSDEHALQDEAGEVHRVRKNQVREIRPAP